MASMLVGDGCAIAPRGVALGCLALGRDVCAEDTRRQQTQPGGFDNAGQPIILEIDESYFYSRKYHRGRIVNGTGLSSRARLNWGSLCGFCSSGRLTFHLTTWRGTSVSRLGRWSTGPISSGTSVRRTRGDSRRRSVASTTLGSRSSSRSTSPTFIVGNTTAAES